MRRKCDYCGRYYDADKRNLNRGWGLCCSKSCAASKREKSKPGYNEQRVKRNNRRRILWNDAPYMSVGRAILAGATFDDGYDPSDDEYWNGK